MPRLYNITEDFNRKEPRYNPCEFFPSANYRSDYLSSNCYWHYDMDADFSYQSYIHIDNLDTSDQSYNTSFWIPLRRCVEREYTGDVFYQYKKMNYKWCWNSDATSDYQREYNNIKHGYWVFYFENDEDQLMFHLKFGDMTADKTYRFHPNYGISNADRRYDVPDDDWID